MAMRREASTNHILVVSFSPTVQKTLIYGKPWKRNEVNRTDRALIHASGKGANTARVLAQSGEDCSLLTQVGGPLKDFFVGSLENEGVRMISVDSGVPLRFCYTILEEEPYGATELVEEGDPIPPGLEDRLFEKFMVQADGVGLLIVAGSSSPGFSKDVYIPYVKEADRRNIPVVVDRHGALLQQLLDVALIVKINMYEFLISYMPEKEWSQEVGEELYPVVTEKGREINALYGHRFVLTNGGDDTLIIDRGGRASRLTPQRLKPVNPIGCGDAVTAGTAAGLNRGLSLKESVKLGMEWAALNLVRAAPGTLR